MIVIDGNNFNITTDKPKENTNVVTETKDKNESHTKNPLNVVTQDNDDISITEKQVTE